MLVKPEFTVFKPQELPEASCPRIAVLGRSNVGKSSLLNSITHPKKVFRVGRTPGVTQGLIAARLQLAASKHSTVELVDLPGFGFVKRKSGLQKQWNDLAESLKEKSPALLWWWLLDPQRAPEEMDQSVAEWLEGEQFQIVFCRSDRLKAKGRVQAEKNWEQWIEESQRPVLWCSALKGLGVKELLKSARVFVQSSLS